MTRQRAPESAPYQTGLGSSDQGQNTSDLDQARALLASPPDVLARIFEIVDALARHRKIDPELRVDILRVAEHVAPGLVEQLEEELDIATPGVVLEAHWHELIEDRPRWRLSHALTTSPRRRSKTGFARIQGACVASCSRLTDSAQTRSSLSREYSSLPSESGLTGSWPLTSRLTR